MFSFHFHVPLRANLTFIWNFLNLVIVELYSGNQVAVGEDGGLLECLPEANIPPT